MPRLIHDFTGRRFCKLIVIRKVEIGSVNSKWECKCDCGTVKIVRSTELLNGRAKSCGCYKKEFLREANTTHGLSKDKERRYIYSRWIDIKRRCYDETHGAYKNYGARGIKVCQQWKDSFETFLADMGFPERKSLSIDRIDNSGHYSPENCRWATAAEQARNRRSTCKYEYRGNLYTTKDLVEITGLPYQNIMAKIYRGVSICEILDPHFDTLIMPEKREDA
jgi:hypothetical protein